MLEPIKHFLNSKRIILASGSPRRKDIIEKNLGLQFEIIPSEFAEDLDKSKFASPAEYAMENSKIKALDVANINADQNWFLIIGADSVVAMDDFIYEKPRDEEDALNTLKKLSNKLHTVCTGVTLVSKAEHSSEKFKVHSFYEVSQVKMADLSDEVIRAYVDSKEPFDKAGSYGIQGLGSSLVESISGDFFNIQGFPAHKFSIELKKFIHDIK